MSVRISSFDLEHHEVGKAMPVLDYCQALEALRRTRLEHVNIGSSYVWPHLRAIRAIAKAPSNIVDSGWLVDEAYNEKYRGKPDIQKESTYDNCVDIDLNLKNCQFRITMWDGGSFHGRRENERCWWHVKADGPHDPSIEKVFTPIFVQRLLEHAADLWGEAEVDRQQREMFDIYRKLIS